MFPKSRFEIRQTEAFRAASASIEYLQGTPDGKRPGVFYVPILDASTFNINSGMESTFLHEAVPGHHYQGSLQMEDSLLPAFRRFKWYGAYGEGWALYAESWVPTWVFIKILTSTWAPWVMRSTGLSAWWLTLASTAKA